MRASVQATDLAAALKQAIIVGATTLPILNHARIEASRGELTLETSDAAVFVRSVVPAEIEEEGAVLLPVALLGPLAAGEGAIVLRCNGEARRGRSHFHLPAMPADAFPSAEEVDYTPVQVDAARLGDAIRAVEGAANPDDALRPFCRCVHIVPGAVWAADGFRIARVSLDYDGPRISVEAAKIKHLLPLLVEGAKVLVGLNQHGKFAQQLRVETERQQVTTTLVAVEPPSIADIVARLSFGDRQLVFQRTELAAALRRLLPFARYGRDNGAAKGKPAATTMWMSSQGGRLRLHDRGEDNVEDLADALAEGADGDFLFAFNPQQMLGALNALGGGRVALQLPAGTGGTASIRLNPEGVSPDDTAYFIAPMVG